MDSKKPGLEQSEDSNKAWTRTKRELKQSVDSNKVRTRTKRGLQQSEDNCNQKRIVRAVHHDPRTPYRSNRTQYRTDRTENHKNLQTAEKSRGWLGFERFLDGIDRLGAIYLLKNFRTNEKLSNPSIRSVGRSIDRIDRRPPCNKEFCYVATIEEILLQHITFVN